MRGLAVAALALGTLAGCAVSPPAGDPDPRVGLASWYGQRHHGRPTASGQPFDMHQLVAAHRTLPFGTRVRVVDLDNGRTVVVRIVDRGPHVPGRVIDLSHAAAASLGMLDRGVARVRLEVLDPTGE
jgi:rare lipoprotein A